MSTPADVRLARRVLRHELEAIRGNWGWILALGIILIVVGSVAVAMPIVARLASAVTFGVAAFDGRHCATRRRVLDPRLERLLPQPADGCALSGPGIAVLRHSGKA